LSDVKLAKIFSHSVGSLFNLVSISWSGIFNYCLCQSTNSRWISTGTTMTKNEIILKCYA
jgi:hypothetical protein